MSRRLCQCLMPHSGPCTAVTLIPAARLIQRFEALGDGTGRWLMGGHVMGLFDADQLLSMASAVRTSTSDVMSVGGKPFATFTKEEREALAELFTEWAFRLMGLERHGGPRPLVAPR